MQQRLRGESLDLQMYLSLGTLNPRMSNDWVGLFRYLIINLCGWRIKVEREREQLII